MDRICFSRGVAIESGCADSKLSPINGHTDVITPETGDLVFVGDHPKVSLSFPCAELKPLLEESAPKGESHLGFFRSALLSTSPVDEFMHLYNILLMFFDDKKNAHKNLDAFILKVNPHVEMRPNPRNPQKNETVFTQLRHEYAHSRRKGVGLEQRTKIEMAERVAAMREITKRTIELLS